MGGVGPQARWAWPGSRRRATRSSRRASARTSHPTRAAAIASIGDYIENFYNLKRRHSRLAYMSPLEFELKTYVTALAASWTCPRKRGRTTAEVEPVQQGAGHETVPPWPRRSRPLHPRHDRNDGQNEPGERVAHQKKGERLRVRRHQPRDNEPRRPDGDEEEARCGRGAGRAWQERRAEAGRAVLQRGAEYRNGCVQEEQTPCRGRGGMRCASSGRQEEGASMRGSGGRTLGRLRRARPSSVITFGDHPLPGALLDNVRQCRNWPGWRTMRRHPGAAPAADGAGRPGRGSGRAGRQARRAGDGGRGRVVIHGAIGASAGIGPAEPIAWTRRIRSISSTVMRSSTVMSVGPWMRPPTCSIIAHSTAAIVFSHADGWTPSSASPRCTARESV
ncbi:uncharacterized protein SOCE26_036980 [Sorangium cellulosum]|uniref:Integrase catalytic domain-containing protein n=1 Tax=Sorangium cellulosum TaxID=56 RepID=A0A2L0ESG6_SORCE|nr:uncharacterized protein SOCE26_036980 [Sorangium cellulosum]